jgi:hypothetical protein
MRIGKRKLPRSPYTNTRRTNAGQNIAPSVSAQAAPMASASARSGVGSLGAEDRRLGTD